MKVSANLRSICCSCSLNTSSFNKRSIFYDSRTYGLNNKVSWKRLAVTCCPSMQTRNKILDQKLRSLGKKVNINAFDLCPSADPDSLFVNTCKPEGGLPQLFCSSQTDPLDINENDFKVLQRAVAIFFSITLLISEIWEK